MKTNHLFAFAALLVGMTLTACSPDSVAQPEGAKAATSSSTVPPNAPPKTHMLAIVGYNYTDRYIDHFSVAGQGGGNLDISTPTAGGGSSMCCVTWTDRSTLPRILKVLWVGAYCIQRRTNSDGETSDTREPLWKTTDAVLTGPVPANPTQLEVHFYRDNHVELAMSDTYSPPRLILPAPPNGYVRPGVVVNDPPCTEDYDRATARRKATPVSSPGVK